jgi:hypothetical protein
MHKCSLVILTLPRICGREKASEILFPYAELPLTFTPCSSPALAIPPFFAPGQGKLNEMLSRIAFWHTFGPLVQIGLMPCYDAQNGCTLVARFGRSLQFIAHGRENIVHHLKLIAFKRLLISCGLYRLLELAPVAFKARDLFFNALDKRLDRCFFSWTYLSLSETNKSLAGISLPARLCSGKHDTRRGSHAGILAQMIRYLYWLSLFAGKSSKRGTTTEATGF